MLLIFAVELLRWTPGATSHPRAGDQLASVIEQAAQREAGHLADMIETLFPNTPKLEMFARGELVSGWDR